MFTYFNPQAFPQGTSNWRLKKIFNTLLAWDSFRFVVTACRCGNSTSVVGCGTTWIDWLLAFCCTRQARLRASVSLRRHAGFQNIYVIRIHRLQHGLKWLAEPILGNQNEDKENLMAECAIRDEHDGLSWSRAYRYRTRCCREHILGNLIQCLSGYRIDLLVYKQGGMRGWKI